jgi:probable DNA metabolism protein
VATDNGRAARVYEAIGRKLSSHDLRRVYRVFLSCDPSKETKLLRYLELGFKTGPKISSLHGNPVVFDVQQIDGKVNLEVHRFCGLVRFSVLKGEVLYAPIEPDHDICELLAKHFCDRYRNDPFIIHDKKRSKALIAYGGSYYISAFSQQNLPGFSDEEEEYQLLWKKFFEAIAIKERTNPRCQKNLMPVRYWSNLTECQSSPFNNSGK